MRHDLPDLDTLEEVGGVAPRANYNLRVIEAIEGTSRAGAPQSILTIDFVDTPPGRYRQIMEYLTDPIPGDSAAGKQFKLDKIKRVTAAFGVSNVGGYDPQDFHGRSANVPVKIEAGEKGFSDKNVLDPPFPK